MAKPKNAKKAVPAKNNGAAKKPAAGAKVPGKVAGKVASKAAGSKPASKTAASVTPKAPTKSPKIEMKGEEPKSSRGSSPQAPALNPKRKLGLRGAAPWAARHAAKHAAEARARAAEPAPPGSARATIRTPTGAEEIKAKIAELHNQTQKVRTLRKRLDKGFFEIGQVLAEIQMQGLYQAKGYGSFEAFLEREIDLGKLTCLKLMKIPTIFQREAAYDYGMDRLFAAISALEGELIPKAIPSAPGSKPALPLKPPSRLVG